jgi:hypothetical protein
MGVCVRLFCVHPQKMALTLLTSGGRSIGIVRSRTPATEFFYVVLCVYGGLASGRFPAQGALPTVYIRSRSGRGPTLTCRAIDDDDDDDNLRSTVLKTANIDANFMEMYGHKFCMILFCMKASNVQFEINP